MSAGRVRPLVIVVSLSAAAFLLTAGQELPTRNEDEFQLNLKNEEIFYDTNLIPDGHEVTSYIRKDISSRFFFIVEEDDTPLAILIAPCSSSVTTRIRYQTKPEDYDIEKPDTSDELLSQMHRDSKKNRRRVKKLLLTRTGREEVKFQKESSASGLYSVEVIAHDQDTTIYLYATTTPDSDRLFPELPMDPNIRVVSVSSDVISVAWKPSPTDAHHGIPIEYCVSANRKQNFHKRCSALTSIYGDVPPTPPPNAGFGFPWEKTTVKPRRKSPHSTPKPPDSDRVFYACVGNKTSYTFSKVEAGAMYYIDVFAVNSQTNRSTTYKGMNVTTPHCPAQKKSHIGAGKVYKFQTKNKNCSHVVEHTLKKSTTALQVAIQPCTDDEVRVNIERGQSRIEGNVQSESPVIKISIPDPELGTYKFLVASSEAKNVAFKMAVATNEGGLPFPVLPNDRKIRVVDSDNSSSCRSVMLMWNVAPADQPQQYCLYMERPKSNKNPEGTRKANRNRCNAVDSLRGKAKKVMCKTVPNNGTHAITSVVEVVSDLRPSTRYTFDVVAVKEGKEAVAYDTLNMKTRKC